VVEIPRGEKTKYEYRKDRDVLFLDRVLYSSVHYPENYGFVPGTLGRDGDPLDMLLFCQEPLLPLTLAEARFVGGLKMEDEKGVDDKILAVAVKDPQYSEVHSLGDLPGHRMNEVRHFFEVYKKLEKKKVAVHEYYGREKALAVAEQSIQEFRNTYDIEDPCQE
jgi:inorganic pyrophosphatase